jgi:hypothetical protein
MPATPMPSLPGAACAGEPTGLFFPDDEAGAAAALAVCATCPVRTRTACLLAAQARGERSGVWGGVDFEAGKRKPGRPAGGTELRGVQALKTAARLGKLRAEHGTLRATAAAAFLSPATARRYLSLLNLDDGSRELVRSGQVTPAAAVAAMRSARRDRERAS